MITDLFTIMALRERGSEHYAKRRMTYKDPLVRVTRWLYEMWNLIEFSLRGIVVGGISLAREFLVVRLEPAGLCCRPTPAHKRAGERGRHVQKLRVLRRGEQAGEVVARAPSAAVRRDDYKERDDGEYLANDSQEAHRPSLWAGW